jgi:DNA-binding LacI/PurR family transcriptional regulator
MTLGALRALHEMGRRIPNDVASWDSTTCPWATSLNPPLTAVAQPAQEIGESAAELQWIASHVRIVPSAT